MTNDLGLADPWRPTDAASACEKRWLRLKQRVCDASRRGDAREARHCEVHANRLLGAMRVAYGDDVAERANDAWETVQLSQERAVA